MSQPTTKKTTLKPHGLRVLDGTKKMLEMSVSMKIELPMLTSLNRPLPSSHFRAVLQLFRSHDFGGS